MQMWNSEEDIDLQFKIEIIYSIKSQKYLIAIAVAKLTISFKPRAG